MSTPQATNPVYDKHQKSLRHDHENHQSSDTLSKIKRFGISLNNRHSAAAGVVFLLGMGYYFLSRQSNGMKVLMNHKGKRAKYVAARMYDGIDHLVTDFCKKVAAVEPRTPLQLVYRPGENHVEMDERGVGMFCFAEHGTMFLVIIDPHDGVKPPAGVTYERKLNLIAGAGEDTMIAFSVYSVPASSSSDLVVTFVVDALKKHLLSETDSFSAHGLLTSHHFRAAHRIPMPFDQQICIAASSRDFEYLSERFVDFRGKSPVLTSAFLVDRRDMAWSQNPGGVVLIGGESGSGKTWAMITNYFQMTDLTVYIRPTEVFATFDNEWGNDDVDKEERNKAFCSLLAAAVRVAIDRVCKPLNEKLKKLSDPQGFAVRVCLDEIGGNPIVTRACCANDSNKNLRNELGWADGVEIRLFGAGTGVGSVSNPGGSENKYYQLAMLDAPRGIGMYWEYRLNLWNSMTSGAAQNDPRLQPIVNLKESVKYLHGKWSGSPEERAEALRKRDEMLWEAFAKDTRVSKEKESKPINTNYATLGREDLVAEAIFSAIESDGTCVAVLHNPRLAALMVAQCKLEARRTCQDEVCAKTSGTNIRRRILLPVASKFRQKNGLQEVTADEAFQLLVESLRYTIFDGYKSANPDDVDYSANRLATRRGVLVDNTIFVEAAKFNEKEYVKVTLDDGHNALPQPEAAASPSQSVQTGQTSTPTYIACYRKDTGRYSISAAMVVVLSNLMSNAFEENFSNIGDVFERAVAKFLFITTQVFHGRPVHELLSFIIGPFAIVGARVLAAVGAKVVAFQSLVLRIGAKLNVGALPKQNVPAAAAAPTSAAQPTGEGDESGEGALYATKRAKAKAQFAKLWKSESRTCAWIEVSPSSLPSADIVLHIPGVITLAFQCKDTAPYLPKEIQKALLIMNPHESTELLPQKLHDLGAPVVPILYMTRAVHNLSVDEAGSLDNRKRQHERERRERERVRKSKGELMEREPRNRVEAVGHYCIFAEGIGEPVVKYPIDYIDTNDKRQNDTLQNDSRLHRVRKIIMQFDLRRKEPDDVEEVTRVDNVRLLDVSGTFSEGSRKSFSLREGAIAQAPAKPESANCEVREARTLSSAKPDIAQKM